MPRQENGQGAPTWESRAAAYVQQFRNATDQAGRQRTIDYLEEHCITGEIAAKYRLGFVDNPLPSEYQFRGCLAIPYLTRGGVAGLRYRCTNPHVHSEHDHGKYLAHTGAPLRVYNPAAYHIARDTDYVIGIAEGEIDAIAATELVGVPSVGIPGVEAWTANRQVWRLTFRDFDRVLIFADGDEPGRNMARAIQSDIGHRALIVKCAPGADVSSTCRDGQADQLREKAGL